MWHCVLQWRRGIFLTAAVEGQCRLLSFSRHPGCQRKLSIYIWLPAVLFFPAVEQVVRLDFVFGCSNGCTVRLGSYGVVVTVWDAVRAE